ncbi:MAG TPA: cation transporter [Anaerolineae bacterium]|nr:cation transporter [Anaerolineae bacterium]
MRWIRQILPDKKKSRLYRKALQITVIGNLLLAVIKSIAAYLSGSTAVFSDAANSFSDVLYSLLLIIGLGIAQQPPDITHPQGHERFEPLMGLIVTILMGLAGFEALRSSVLRFLAGGAVIELGLPTSVLIMSAIIKMGMFYSVVRIARKINSPSLEAASRDNLSDTLTTLAALLGVFGSSFIHPLFDPAAGIIVSVWIFRTAYLTAKENLGYLTGAGADEKLRKEILQTARSVSGVQNVHYVVSEYVGPKLVVEMHINLDGRISLDEAHTICDSVARAVETMPEVDRAYVHAEPQDHL